MGELLVRAETEEELESAIGQLWRVVDVTGAGWVGCRDDEDELGPLEVRLISLCASDEELAAIWAAMCGGEALEAAWKRISGPSYARRVRLAEQREETRRIGEALPGVGLVVATFRHWPLRVRVLDLRANTGSRELLMTLEHRGVSQDGQRLVQRFMLLWREVRSAELSLLKGQEYFLEFSREEGGIQTRFEGWGDDEGSVQAEDVQVFRAYPPVLAGGEPTEEAELVPLQHSFRG